MSRLTFTSTVNGTERSYDREHFIRDGLWIRLNKWTNDFKLQWFLFLFVSLRIEKQNYRRLLNRRTFRHLAYEATRTHHNNSDQTAIYNNLSLDHFPSWGYDISRYHINFDFFVFCGWQVYVTNHDQIKKNEIYPYVVYNIVLLISNEFVERMESAIFINHDRKKLVFEFYKYDSNW